MCRRPRKPQRKPNPSASEVSGSQVEGGVVEGELLERLTEVVVAIGVEREEPAEDHRLHLPVALERLGRRVEARGERVADAQLGDVLEAGDHVADLARLHPLAPPSSAAGRIRGRRARPRCRSASRGSGRPCGSCRPSSGCRRSRPGTGRTRSRRSVPAAPRPAPPRRGDPATIASSTSSTPIPVLARSRIASSGSVPSSSAISSATRSGSAPGRSTLLRTGISSRPASTAAVGVGDGLRLDALGGVDDQQRALAGGQRARDLVGEVDVAGRVDQVQVVGLAVGRRVLDAHGLRLDRDPALPLEVHRVEHCERMSRGSTAPVTSRMRSASVDLP